MPLDDFQKKVLKILCATRTPESVFAGGSVLQRHAFWLSMDQDIFHGLHADINATADADIAMLESNGFAVHNVRRYEGFVEISVGAEGLGNTKVQWVQAGMWLFFSPVPDEEYGWRLHYADLAVNKILAAAGRKEFRDFVDLLLIDKHIMPLWHAVWAAPGKDDEWSPYSLIERISRNNSFKEEDVEDVISMIDISAGEVCRSVRAALDEANTILHKLPQNSAGNIFITTEGDVTNDLDTIIADKDVCLLPAKRGGAWPSSPSIDHEIVEKMIREFGLDGENIPFP